jgi:hypothetical protein
MPALLAGCVAIGARPGRGAPEIVARRARTAPRTKSEERAAEARDKRDEERNAVAQAPTLKNHWALTPELTRTAGVARAAVRA